MIPLISNVFNTKGEADDPNCLENTRLNEGEPLGRVAFEFRRSIGAFDHNGGDDDEHSDESQA